MIGYHGVDELEVRLRSGRGIAVLVEGESYEDDPWFYGRWFGDHARELAFFPQNGWPQVVAAVAELRGRLPGHEIYGIIDRDFAAEDQLESELATHGIVRTPRFTLENYLLDPGCWAAVFRVIFARRLETSTDWVNPDTVAGKIEAAFRSCLCLAAYNRTVHHATAALGGLGTRDESSKLRYCRAPEALPSDPAHELASLGKRLGVLADLGQVYTRFLATLAEGKLDLWHQLVNGKEVLRLFHRSFPPTPRGGKHSIYDYLNKYMDKCPEPPSDLARIIDRLLADARQRT